MTTTLSIELRYTSFAEWGYGISDYYSYDADKKYWIKRVWKGGGGGGGDRGTNVGHLQVVSYSVHDY